MIMIFAVMLSTACCFSVVPKKYNTGVKKYLRNLESSNSNIADSGAKSLFKIGKPAIKYLIGNKTNTKQFAGTSLYDVQVGYLLAAPQRPTVGTISLYLISSIARGNLRFTRMPILNRKSGRNLLNEKLGKWFSDTNKNIEYVINDYKKWYKKIRHLSLEEIRRRNFYPLRESDWEWTAAYMFEQKNPAKKSVSR